MFHVGQKVVCIADDWASWAVQLGGNMPRAKTIYTLRDVARRPWSKIQIGVHLHEITNPVLEFLEGTHEPYFDASFFRPITDTKTSTSFTEGAPKDSERWDNRHKQPEHTHA